MGEAVTLRVAARSWECWQETPALPEQEGTKMETCTSDALPRRLRPAQEDATRVRNQILAIVALDLRNSLGAILLGGEAARERTTSPEDRDALLGLIQRTAADMDRLVGDVLDIARMDGGWSRSPSEPVDLPELFDEVVAVFAVEAASRQVSITREYSADLPRAQVAPGGVLEVLTILLRNATRHVRYGGRIVVRTRAAKAAVRISVQDDGPGLSHEVRDEVFDRFWQARRTGREGAGCGLAIARGIVESQGGEIWVESEPGCGCTFHFTVPVAAP